MSVLSDKWIRKMSKEEDMISPFEEKQVRGDSISYGLSSFGYDARVSDEFKIFTNVNSEIVDPKFPLKRNPHTFVPSLARKTVVSNFLPTLDPVTLTMRPYRATNCKLLPKYFSSARCMSVSSSMLSPFSHLIVVQSWGVEAM